eukprot:gene12648-13947_t
MDQMEHNIKIKTHKKDLDASPFVKSVKIVDRPRDYNSSKEEERMLERFKDFHWQREKATSIGGHKDRMAVLRCQQNDIISRQAKDKEDVERHRISHLQSIKDNINTSRDRFFRSTQLGRRINEDEHYIPDTRNNFKIINDGLAIKY